MCFFIHGSNAPGVIAKVKHIYKGAGLWIWTCWRIALCMDHCNCLLGRIMATQKGTALPQVT